MKVFPALLLVSALSLAGAQPEEPEPPHGSRYLGELLCPLPPLDDPEADSAACPNPCNQDSDCSGGASERCCPTTPSCRECVEAITTDARNCEIDDGDTFDPLNTYIDDCKFCVCVNGDIYCHKLENCTNIPDPIEGANCEYGDRNIAPGELTLVQSEDEECRICVCGNGLLFCTSCGEEVTCELDDGEEISLGETLTYDDGCTVCTCAPNGEVECTPSDAFCPSVLCEYNGEELMVGDTVPSEDGCNECTCFENSDVGCTERACFNPCTEPMEVGPCDAVSPSWFYNSDSGECEMFNYGGCEGNANRFESLQACQAECDEDACPDGQTPVTCDGDPCQNAECETVDGAECSVDHCRGCRPLWYLQDQDVTDQCDTGCPDGVSLVSCFADPCEVSTCDEVGAECVANYCGGCNAFWFLEDREVCQEESECPAGVDEVACFAAPCLFASCPAFPFARCVDDYCGGCNARFYTEDGEVTEDCEGECEDGEERVFCLRRPCEDAVCPELPEATCVDDYCGGCNVRWMLEGEDVTERCFESRGPLEPNDYPTCPAVEIDTCSEECESHSNCTATQLCCRGCGSACREAVNLPYYKVPLTCPPQVVALSDESDVCDVECLSDSQCSGDRVCCRSGCSSSCQVGMMPPEPCHIVRQLIEGMDDRDDEDDEDGGTNNGGGPALVGQFVPGCLEEGYFNPVQIWENNGWCVDVVTGKPISVAYTLSDDPVISCPNCTYNGDVFYAGQTFYDGCNTCVCTETGLAACTRRACLDPCTLPAEVGSCEDRVTQYFFDADSRQCESFVYSGCGGNANRFSTAEDCFHACRPESVCLLEWDEGEPCDDEDDSVIDFFYFYNAEEGQCNITFGYNCGGNGNRFHSGLDCLDTCEPSNPGPTDAYGNPCYLIACDIPICEDGYEIGYSDESCCPFCQPDDLEECDDDEFMCREGYSCIPYAYVCDGLSDCDDGSDELGDECDVSVVPCEFSCSENQCVPESYVCDGVLDCENALDEFECEDDEYVFGAPFYMPPLECPDTTDILGPCDVSECTTDAGCGGERLCCPNNCNRRTCVPPVAASPACSAIVAALSANVSYIPQCLASGDYRPLQCSGEGAQKMCWCVNVLSGIPYTVTHTSFYPECERCSYNGAHYAPGERYTAEDGCNTCLCSASGDSICTRTACVEEDCELEIAHGETRVLDCLTCSCMYGQLNCSHTGCGDLEPVLTTVRVEMTFDGELPTDEEELEELERDALISLLRTYGQTMDLGQDQIEIVEVYEGSVVIVVVFEDRDDQTGANVTVLVYQLEEDYMDGTLIIRLDDGALVPSGDRVVVERVSRDDGGDDGEEFVWWYGVIIGVGGIVILLAVAISILAIVMYFHRKSSRTLPEKGENLYTGTVEMKKVPLDEKA